MAVTPTDSWILQFASVLAAIAIYGCTPDAPADQPTPQNAKDSEPRSRQDRLEGEKTIVLAGGEGKMLLSQGTVLSAEGAACPNALVTLEQNSEGAARRCLFARSDSHGNYVIRGDTRVTGSNMVWAVSEGGQLGVSWNSEEPVTIRLRGGSTVLYVRTKDCTPIENATVTVYQSSIDDISNVVPPNIRRHLRRETDQNGFVEFPSTFGDGDLGFHVRASGERAMMRDGYSSLDTNLFVMDRARESSVNCADAIRQKVEPVSADRRRINTGGPTRLPPYLLPSAARDSRR